MFLFLQVPQYPWRNKSFGVDFVSQQGERTSSCWNVLEHSLFSCILLCKWAVQTATALVFYSSSLLGMVSWANVCIWQQSMRSDIHCRYLSKKGKGLCIYWLPFLRRAQPGLFASGEISNGLYRLNDISSSLALSEDSVYQSTSSSSSLHGLYMRMSPRSFSGHTTENV